MRSVFAGALLAAGMANAHLVAWSVGMYCKDGNTGSIDLNAYNVVLPLWQLSQEDWWFHHTDNCDQFPPPDGEFLELPAGGTFTVEIAANRALTTLSYDGQYATDWGDGETHPDDYSDPNCISSPNMHTQNQSMAAGTAFAISYESDLANVTPENLVVFSVRYNTPWKRVTVYDVPADLPACPEGGCICAWGWIPNGCGEPNMYHTGYKCNVTGATSTVPVAQAQPPVWCEDDTTKCVQGAKQMLYWNQAEGNNIEVDGYDLEGSHKSPAYNNKCGFPDGAQNDIFATGGSGDSSATTAAATTTTQATSTIPKATTTKAISTTWTSADTSWSTGAVWWSASANATTTRSPSSSVATSTTPSSSKTPVATPSSTTPSTEAASSTTLSSTYISSTTLYSAPASSTASDSSPTASAAVKCRKRKRAIAKREPHKRQLYKRHHASDINW